MSAPRRLDLLRKGQRYRTTRDLDVGVLTHYRAPFTGGAKAILRAGEIVAVTLDPPAFAVAASCLPERYEALQAELVPEEDRSDEKYAGYSLVIEFDKLERDCELIDPLPEKS